MTGHVVSFTPVGAPTRAVCSCGWHVTDDGCPQPLRCMSHGAEDHAFEFRGTVEFAGLPPVERAS